MGLGSKWTCRKQCGIMYGLAHCAWARVVATGDTFRGYLCFSADRVRYLCEIMNGNGRQNCESEARRGDASRIFRWPSRIAVTENQRPVPRNRSPAETRSSDSSSSSDIKAKPSCQACWSGELARQPQKQVGARRAHADGRLASLIASFS